jgi:gas vesicle protein
MRKIANFISGLIFGAVIGGTLALLFAPKSGPKFRRELEVDFEKLRDELDAAIDEPHILLEKFVSPEKQPV